MPDTRRGGHVCLAPIAALRRRTQNSDASHEPPRLTEASQYLKHLLALEHNKAVVVMVTSGT